MAYTADLIPSMTGNTAPSGVASASSTYNNNDVAYGPWRALNDAAGNEWCPEQYMPAWLQYQFAAAKTITQYTVQANYEGLFTPNTWTFSGSNDGSNFTVLDTQTDITGWGAGEKRTYPISNAVAYAYYRLNITVTNSAGGYLYVAELEMMETAETFADDDLDGSHRLLAWADDDLDGSHKLCSYVDDDLDGSYFLLGVDDLDGSHRLLEWADADDLDGSHRLLVYADDDLVGAHRLFGWGLDDLDGSHRLLNWAADDLDGSHLLWAFVDDDLDGSYLVEGRAPYVAIPSRAWRDVQVVLTAPGSDHVVRYRQEVVNCKTSRARQYGCETASFDLVGVPATSYRDELQPFARCDIYRDGEHAFGGLLTDPTPQVDNDGIVRSVAARGFMSALGDDTTFRATYADDDKSKWRQTRGMSESMAAPALSSVAGVEKLEWKVDPDSWILAGTQAVPLAYELWRGSPLVLAIGEPLSGLSLDYQWRGYADAAHTSVNGFWSSNIFPDPRAMHPWAGSDGVSSSLISVYPPPIPPPHAAHAWMKIGHFIPGEPHPEEVNQWAWDFDIPSDGSPWIGCSLWICFHVCGGSSLSGYGGPPDAFSVGDDDFFVRFYDGDGALLEPTQNTGETDVPNVHRAIHNGDDWFRICLHVPVPELAKKGRIRFDWAFTQDEATPNPYIWRYMTNMQIVCSHVPWFFDGLAETAPPYLDPVISSDYTWFGHANDSESGYTEAAKTTVVLAGLDGASLLRFYLFACEDPDIEHPPGGSWQLLFSRNAGENESGHIAISQDALDGSYTALVGILANGLEGYGWKRYQPENGTAPARMGMTITSLRLHATSLDTDGRGEGITPKAVMEDLVVGYSPWTAGTFMPEGDGDALSSFVFDECTTALEAVQALAGVMGWDYGYEFDGIFYFYPLDPAPADRDLYVLPYRECLVDLTRQVTDCARSVVVGYQTNDGTVGEVVVYAADIGVSLDVVMPSAPAKYLPAPAGINIAAGAYGAEAYGAAYLRDHAGAMLTGTITLQRELVCDAAGAPHAAHLIREGQFVWLRDAPPEEAGLIQITRAAVDHDALTTTLEVGQSSFRLDRIIARLARKAGVR